MKKLLIIIFSLIGFTALAQPGSLSQSVYRSRVNDSTTVVPSDASGYGSLYWNNQATSPGWRVWVDGVGYVIWDPTASGSGGGGHTIEEEGTPLTQRTGLNFVGTYITATDDAGNDETDVTVSIPDADDDGTTKGVAAFNNNDFDAASGVVTIAASRNVVGAQDLFITGPAMWPTLTSGCEPATDEIGGKTYKVLDFDQSADENAQFQFSLPRNYNNGTITATVYWTATTGSGTVQWEVSAVALSNDDPFSTSLGTAVAIDDTLIATDDVHVSPTSSAITIGGTPADGDLIFMNIVRDVSDDTLSGDARLLGVRITITLDSAVSE